MNFLFAAPGKDLKSFFESLNIEGVRDNIHSSTFYKGKEYYENGYVSDAKYTYGQACFTAHVQGTLKYDVILELREGKLYGKCSCPVGGVCKHIAAVLFFAVNEVDHVTVAENRGTGSLVRQHLQSLSKAELIAMVEKYAPEQFFIETKNRYSGKEDSIKVFKKVERAIANLFQGSESLYSPYDFEASLVKEIGKLSGLENHLKEELDLLILYIIREVDNAFDEGYLYDHYKDVHFEEPEAFTTLVENYIKNLPHSEKIDFLGRLDVVLTESSYSTFKNLSTLYTGNF